MYKCTLKEHVTYEENGELYLRLKYEIEDDHRIREVTIPKIVLGIIPSFTPGFDIVESSDYVVPYDRADVRLGAHTYTMEPIRHGAYWDIFYLEEVTMYKPVEMTLEEIEEKLGYKVTIVSEKEKEN